MISVSTMRPFTRCLMTIGMLPTSYLVSMTYEEQLLWLCNYLEKEVIPALNNNAEALKEVQDLYVELKKYVDNYFSNLDVQEEINNKLDEMATDGTLDRIINQEIFGELNEKVDSLTNEVHYHFINTGLNRGDCIGIQTENEFILNDLSANTSANMILTYLQNKGISKVNRIIISHFHYDHIGGANAEGMRELVNSSLIDSETQVYLPLTPDFTRFINDTSTPASDVVGRVRATMTAFLNACALKNLTVHYMTTGDTLTIDKTVFRFLNCSETEYNNYYNITQTQDGEHFYTNYNNFSMVTEVKNLNNTTLLTGDIESKAQELTAPFIKSKITLKKIAHHGVSYYANADYLIKTNAKISVYMNTTNDSLSTGKCPEIASNLVLGNAVYSSNYNGSMEFIDNGISIVSTSNLEVKEYSVMSAVAGFDSLNVQGVKNLSIVPSSKMLQNGDDLNDIKACGDYISQTGEISASLINSPVSTAAFKLTVEFTNSNERIIQTVTRNSIFQEKYTRFFDGTNWNPWQREATHEHIFAKTSQGGTITGSDYVKIPFDSVVASATSSKLELDTVNNRIVSRYNGTYKIEGFLNLSQVDEGDIVHVGLFVNNERVNRADFVMSGTIGTVSLPSWIVTLSANQFVDFRIYNETKGSLTYGIINSFIAYEV